MTTLILYILLFRATTPHGGYKLTFTHIINNILQNASIYSKNNPQILGLPISTADSAFMASAGIRSYLFQK